jgi:hypothetical protein
MKTATGKTELVKLHHTLASKLGMNEDQRRAMLAGWGAESSKDLSVDELQQVCSHMKSKVNENNDKWRKRVMASIFGYMKLTGRVIDSNYVKKIACRSAGNYQSFNHIPTGKLQTVYYAFQDKQKVLKRTGELMNDDLDVIQFQN